MDTQSGLWLTAFLVVIQAISAAATNVDDARLEVFKRSPRVSIHTSDSEALRVVRRLIRREAIKHNRYQYLRDQHLQLIHPRRKRGWLHEDPINRATEFPSSTTTSTHPPPPINPSLQTTVPTQQTTTASTQQTASASTQQTATASTQQTIVITQSTTNTTESSAACVLLPSFTFNVVVISMSYLSIVYMHFV